MKTKVQIKGKLASYFETGSEGTSWILQDESHIDKNGMYSYEGTHILKNRTTLEIYWENNEIWKGRLQFINTFEAPSHPYFKQYVKAAPLNPKYKQLSFAGIWVHNLPTNIDLGLWHDIFFTREGQYTGIVHSISRPD